MLTKLQKNLALHLFEIGIIQFDFEKGWRLVLHEKHPNAPLSPFYIDLRKLQSHVEVKKEAVLALKEVTKNLKYDLIAGIPLAAVALASSMADIVKKPQITPRMDKKTHGKAKTIDGDYQEGDVVLVIDDLITQADSKLKVIKILEKEGLIVKDIAVVFDREQGGKNELAKKNYALHSVLKIKQTLRFYAKERKISSGQLSRVLKYLENPLK